MAQEARGSTKLWDNVFDAEPPTQAALGEHVAAAKQTYQVLRWWKYGQPAIDRIKTTLDIATVDSGPVIQDILNSAIGNKANITLDAFPYGLPKLDRVQVNVIFEKDIGR
jgi:hypothetical protein